MNPSENTLLSDLTALLAQVKALGARYQDLVPEKIRTEARLLDLRGGPNAWGALEFKYPQTPGLDGVNTLGVVAQQLQGLIWREKTKGREVNLKLVTHRQR